MIAIDTSDMATIVEDKGLIAAMHREAADVMVSFSSVTPIELTVRAFEQDGVESQAPGSGGTELKIIDMV